MKPVFYNKLGQPVFDAHNPEAKERIAIKTKTLIILAIADMVIWYGLGLATAIIFL